MDTIYFNRKHIEAFFIVGHLNSFRKAAEELNTTQPAISTRIANLENILGCKLFDRDGNNKVLLTPKGKELLPYAEKIIKKFFEFQNISIDPRVQSGVLRLGVSETIADVWLTDFLKYFNKKFPNIVVELSIDISINLTKQLLENKIDLAFLMHYRDNVNIHTFNLWEVPLKWVASKQTNIGDSLQDIDSLAKNRIITYARHTKPFNEIEQKLSGKCAHIFTSTSLSICRKMVLEGLAISALPLANINKYIQNGSLQIINTDWQPSNLVFVAEYNVSPYTYKNNNYKTIIDTAQKIASKYTIV